MKGLFVNGGLVAPKEPYIGLKMAADKREMFTRTALIIVTCSDASLHLGLPYIVIN